MRKAIQHPGRRIRAGQSEGGSAEGMSRGKFRNPAVLANPLTAPEAVAVIQSYRQHPRWKVLGFPPTSRELHTDLWQRAAAPGIARRRIYDTRTALALRAFGVTSFATANVRDFEGFGFVKVWNPMEATPE